MKNIFLSYLLLFWVVSFVNACAQSKIVDFLSATAAVPVDKKVCITDIIYRNGKFDGIQERIVRGRQFKQDNRNDRMGTVIDGAQLVNYPSDTLYVLSTHFIPNASVSTTIKTRKGAFELVQDAEDGYTLRSLEDSYASIPEDEKKSDFLLYEALFTWNMDLLIRLIKSSGGLLGSENVMSATRIILKDNRVLKKDIINFEPALRWHLE